MNDLERRIRHKFESTPVNGFLRFELAEIGEEAAVLTMEPRAEYLQEGGVIQGGIVSSLADTATAYALAPQLPDGYGMTGIEYKINFLRPARLEEGLLSARARVLRRGRRIGVCSVDVLQNERTVATGIFTYLLFAREADRR